jgi:hypothetical protein
MAIGTIALLALRRVHGTWRRALLGTWGLANLSTGLLRYCPSNQLFGIDNTRGREWLHFQHARKLNRLQRRAGLTV